MFVLLMALWLVLSGSLELRNIIIGAVVAALLSAFCSRYIGSLRRPSLRRVLGYGEYFLFLLLEILRSCASVMGLIWSRREVAPKLVAFRAPLRSESDCVLLANSITLTPGTITVDLVDGEMLVHALDAPYAEGLDESGFVERLARLEEEE
ncbi:MAG: Na+/H+ antiporter subunit E [Oscillospiraceae bacterium]|nr:Na+/H+ antiporter subunit E [Oscillospiraceae bacterium]